MTKMNTVEKKSWEKWCLWELWEAGSPQMGREELRLGQIPSLPLRSRCQPSSPLRSRWFHASLWSPGACPPTTLHLAPHTDTLKGIEVLVKSHQLGLILRCHLQRVQDTPRDQGFFCLSNACQQCCRDERLWQLRVSEGQPLQGRCKKRARRLSIFINSFCVFGGDIWRKQGSGTDCFPPFKAIQISSAMVTTGILSLPFFIGSSTENGAAASVLLWDGC